MRSALPILFVSALLCLASESAAQTCRGTAPIDAQTPAYVGGSFRRGNGVTGVSGIVAGGSSAAWGNFEASHINVDDTSLSYALVSTEVGGQIGVDRGRRVVICPSIGFGYTFGPNDVDVLGTSVDFTAWEVFGGGSVGFIAVQTSALQVIPGFGLFVNRTSLKARAEGSSETFDDTSGSAVVGVGIVIRRQLSLSPRVHIPIGVDGADPQFQLLVAVHFGGR
jgi:hypothetical protein